MGPASGSYGSPSGPLSAAGVTMALILGSSEFCTGLPESPEACTLGLGKGGVMVYTEIS